MRNTHENERGMYVPNANSKDQEKVKLRQGFPWNALGNHVFILKFLQKRQLDNGYVPLTKKRSRGRPRKYPIG